MAKILYGSQTAVRTGRLRGFTFQRGPYGNVANTTHWLVNRRTITQGQTRAAFRSVVSQWRDLTELERLSWAVSATNTGGAFRAYTAYNIPYWIAHHEIQRTNPYSRTVAAIITGRAEARRATNMQYVAQEAYFTASVNWAATNIIPKVLIAISLTIGEKPTKAEAVSLPPDFTYSDGTVYEWVLSTSIASLLAQLSPGMIWGYWVTPIDASTQAPRGDEFEMFYTIPTVVNVYNQQFTATVNASNKIQSIHLEAAIGDNYPSISLAIAGGIMVGATPTTPFNPNEIIVINNEPMTVANLVGTVDDQNFPANRPITAQSGNIIYLEYVIFNNTISQPVGTRMVASYVIP